MKRVVIPFFLCAMLLSGCSSTRTGENGGDQQSEPWQSTVFAMDTVMAFTVYGHPELQEPMSQLVSRLESLWSVTDADSEICALNQDGQAALSPETENLLGKGLELCQRSGGALDLSIYPVVRSWGFTTGAYQVPEENSLKALCAAVDYRKIALDIQNHTVSLPKGMEIDLGSIAKGYTGDCLAEMLRQAGVTSALLNLGGNVQAIGAKSDGSPWKVGIRNPLGEGNLGVVQIKNQAVVTSGGYERYFEQDGKTYWHIMDPETGRPADNGLVSVTVIGDEGVVCDAFSTALFVMGLDRAAELWRGSNDFEAVFVDKNGNVSITEGLEGRFKPLDAYADSSVTVIRRG